MTAIRPIVRSEYIGTPSMQYECVTCGAPALWEHADEQIADENAWCDEHLPGNAERVDGGRSACPGGCVSGWTVLDDEAVTVSRCRACNGSDRA